MTVFEWLNDEIAKIKTRKFHLVDGPIRPDQRILVESSELEVPLSYKRFVIEFGNAKLYRKGSQYQVEVYAVPKDAISHDGDQLLQFGRTDSSLVYFKPNCLPESTECPVFEWQHDDGLKQRAAGFDEWLRNECDAARRSFRKKEWLAIEHGPPPFTAEELRIVDQRRRYRWKIAGITVNESVMFEVQNDSDIRLPFLSIGIKGKRRGSDGILAGGIWLPVLSIPPGQSGIVEMDCYKKWVDPRDIHAFPEPDPEPEDRDRYWEFKAVSR